MRGRLACSVAFSWLLAGSSALAAEPDPRRFDNSVFVFGGATTEDDIGNTALLFDTTYEDSQVYGIGYQKFFYAAPYDVSLGVEVGLAGRFGVTDSAELWSGLVARYDGLTLFDTVHIAPALTFGLSAVSETMTGREQWIEAQHEGDAALLFYLGPEINLSLADYPAVEAFWRLHHRSGAWRTLGNMEGGANANVIGLRLHF